MFGRRNKNINGIINIGILNKYKNYSVIIPSLYLSIPEYLTRELFYYIYFTLIFFSPFDPGNILSPFSRSLYFNNILIINGEFFRKRTGLREKRSLYNSKFINRVAIEILNKIRYKPVYIKYK